MNENNKKFNNKNKKNMIVDLSQIVQDFLKIMDKNNVLFDEKLKKINKIKEFELDNTFLNDSNSNFNNQNNNKPLFQQNNDNNNLSSSKLSNRLENIKKEIEYKDSLIKKLNEQLSEKNKENINNKKNNQNLLQELNTLKDQINDKNNEKNSLKKDNENLKIILENLKIENNEILTSKENKINQTENLTISLAEAKDEINLLKKKIYELENKQNNLNNDLDSLNEKYKKIENNKNLINNQIEEQKKLQLNLKKELSISNSNKLLNVRQDNFNNINDNANYNKNSNKNLYNNNMDDNNYNILKTNYNRKSINQNSNYQYKGFDNFPSENKLNNDNIIENNKEYEIKLNNLLQEKNILDNELIKITEHPRTLNEIKLKKEKNERLIKVNEEISIIRNKLKKSKGK